MAKIKFPEKSRKIQINFSSKKGAEGHLEWPRGTHQASTPLGGTASPQVASGRGVAHLGPFKVPPPRHLLSLSRKTPENFLKLVFLMFLPVIFDLLIQPISSADFLRDCSLVCASSTCPIRFVIGSLYLEYFAAIGNRLFEIACLFYA